MRTKIKILFLIITVSFLPSICKAKSVDPIFLTTTIIERISKQKPAGNASGFFYESNNKLFIVTNKHVIYGKKFYEENSNPEIDQIKITLHKNKNDLRDNEEITIDLFNNEKKVWIEHDKKEYDVILIPIEVDRNKYVLTSTNSSYIGSDNIVIGFEKIFVMGYPFGWHDKIHNLPIVRVGHLSSPFEVPYKELPIMLGDVETHPGMSGGPVFMELKDYTTFNGKKRSKHLGAKKMLLVGIHSGQPLWQLKDKRTGTIGKNIPHTLINIWFADIILDILSQK